MAATAHPMARVSHAVRLVSGDFDSLFLAHHQSVFRLAYRIARTREEAEDLTQEAFLRLHRSPGVWQGSPDGARVRAWLYRVVTNLAYNSLRSRSRRERREDAVGLYEAGAADSTEALAEREEQRCEVQQALSTLPQRQMQLLLLRYAGLSYKELAETLNLAPGSIGTLLSRAERAFAQVYGAGGK